MQNSKSVAVTPRGWGLSLSFLFFFLCFPIFPQGVILVFYGSQDLYHVEECGLYSKFSFTIILL